MNKYWSKVILPRRVVGFYLLNMSVGFRLWEAGTKIQANLHASGSLSPQREKSCSSVVTPSFHPRYLTAFISTWSRKAEWRQDNEIVLSFWPSPSTDQNQKKYLRLNTIHFVTRFLMVYYGCTIYVGSQVFPTLERMHNWKSFN